MIWDYSGFDPPYNSRRTLDQFGYPNLHDSRARDDDQMLYKRTKQRPTNVNPVQDSSDDENQVGKNESAEDDVLDGTVLMVDQLWLWALGNGTFR
jgi:hypothetical protein